MKKNVIPFLRSSPHETSNDSLDSKLRFAIANRRLIQISYDGDVRIAEPHDYGQRNGSDKVLVYQRTKQGRHGAATTGWRWLDVLKIQECLILASTFTGTREAAGQHHHDWDVLYARVDHTT
jgi:hypothetical protein